MIITIQVNAPPGSAQAVKEHLAMYCERFGDTTVLDIQGGDAEQMTIGGTPWTPSAASSASKRPTPRPG